MTQTGTYAHSVYEQGCQIKQEYAFVVTGMEERDEIIVTAYPNPVMEEVTVSIPDRGSPVVAEILTLSGTNIGSLILKANGGIRTATFNMVGLKPGFYIVEISGAANLKLIKMQGALLQAPLKDIHWIFSRMSFNFYLPYCLK